MICEITIVWVVLGWLVAWFLAPRYATWIDDATLVQVYRTPLTILVLWPVFLLILLSDWIRS